MWSCNVSGSDANHATTWCDRLSDLIGKKAGGSHHGFGASKEKADHCLCASFASEWLGWVQALRQRRQSPQKSTAFGSFPDSVRFVRGVPGKVKPLDEILRGNRPRFIVTDLALGFERRCECLWRRCFASLGIKAP